MRYLLLAVLLMGLWALGAGCPRSAVEEPSLPPTPPPVPSEVAEPAAPAAQVVLLQVGDEFDEENTEVTRQTRTFKPDSAAIYVVAGIKGLTPGTPITGTLRAVKVVDAEGTEYRDQEVASTSVEAPAEEATVHFDFTPPTKGWPQGSYVAEIAVEDQVIETVDIAVE